MPCLLPPLRWPHRFHLSSELQEEGGRVSGKNHGFRSGNLVTSRVSSSLKNLEKILFDSDPAPWGYVVSSLSLKKAQAILPLSFGRRDSGSKAAHRVQIPESVCLQMRKKCSSVEFSSMMNNNKWHKLVLKMNFGFQSKTFLSLLLTYTWRKNAEFSLKTVVLGIHWKAFCYLKLGSSSSKSLQHNFRNKLFCMFFPLCYTF